MTARAMLAAAVAVLACTAAPAARAQGSGGVRARVDTPAVAPATSPELRRSLVGAAFLENDSYRFLRRLCDQAGGRLVGSADNWKALGILQEELTAAGLSPRLERYSIPGFVRGDDEVVMLAPIERRLRAVALGYVDATPGFEAPVLYLGQGAEEDYAGRDARGSIVLLSQQAVPGRPELLRSQAIRIAAAHGARAALFIHERAGGITMVGVSNFHGDPSPIPAYSLTLEEGAWMRRLCEQGAPPRLRIVTRSRCARLETGNVAVTFPGASARRIVVGAHFDSWDGGQGAVDNGIGSAILFDLARLLARYTPRNRYTVELVWFNGEELGLWGARRYLEMHAQDSILAMVNMDMTGSPRGFTAMGFDPAVPLLRALAADLGGFDLSRDIGNTPWTNSDHQPFMLRGIPTFSLHAHLEQEMVQYYHDLGDSFDKVSRRYLAEAAAVVSVLVAELANNTAVPYAVRSEQETKEFLRRNKLEDRLRQQQEWPFGD